MTLLGAILYIAPLVWYWKEANRDREIGFKVWLGISGYYLLAGYLMWGGE